MTTSFSVFPRQGYRQGNLPKANSFLPARSQQFGSYLPGSSFVTDLADSARRRRSEDFIRWQCSAKFGRGPFQRRSSTRSKTGTSSRKVARVRNNKASFHELSRASDSRRDLRIEGCHCCQSFGMSSR